MDKLKPEIKAELITALRGEKYRQGHGRLRTEDDRYCCLGVLCDLAVQAGVSQWHHGDPGSWSVDGFGDILPPSVARWAFIPPTTGRAQNPTVKVQDERLTLADLNDGYPDSSGVPIDSLTFGDIADVIDEQL